MAHRPRLARSCLFAALGLAACTDPDGPTSWPDVPAPPAASDDWCQRLEGGLAGARSPAVDLSVAHATVRFFGTDGYRPADDALVATIRLTGLAGLDPLAAGGIDAAVGHYAGDLPGVCARTPAPALGPARVELDRSIAFITPGTGPVVIPAGARAIAIDLRDLPEAPGLADALAAAAAAALATPVDGPVADVRHHDGMIDEVFSPDNVYTSSIEAWTGPGYPGSGAGLPLAVLTDATLAPTAARFAGTLRLADRAWILGEDLRTEVAEATWAGVGNGGIAVRTRLLRDGDAPWPDVIAADVRSVDPRFTATALPRMGPPPASSGGGPVMRPVISLPVVNGAFPLATDVAVRRTVPLLAHGALRLFFPYFDVVGDRIDERLDEVIAAAPGLPADRVAIEQLLRRFGEAISDGHNFVRDDTRAAGSLPVRWDEVDGAPVARRSLAAEIHRGDTLVTFDGTPIATWLATEDARTSAATEGYRFELATRRLHLLTRAIDVELRGPDGVTRTEHVTPYPFAALTALGYSPEQRAAGFLADLGAPTVYYLNLGDDVLTDDAQFTAGLAAARDGGATALVLDMRGYPSGDHYQWAMQLAHGPFRSPQFVVPTWHGPDQLEWVTDQYTLDPDPLEPPLPAIPVVLLVGPDTVSAAENFALMAIDAVHPIVVGRRTAGTNGNITGIQLPGGSWFSFTGMRLLTPDGARFHGVGIVPDLEVDPTAASLAAGDPELTRAVAALAP